jgi:DNA-binding IclR family transcriptional regulator
MQRLWEEVPEHGPGRVPRREDVCSIYHSGLGFILRGFSGHDQFEESTEEIAPLTEEEKKQRLDELREALAQKRAKQAVLDKEEQRKNEVRGSCYLLFLFCRTPQTNLACRKSE